MIGPYGEGNVKDRSVATEFDMAIDYRTKRCLAVWSGMVPAATMEEAAELAEKLLRRRRRTPVRVDRITVK
jgi:hypothetical protein